MLGLDDPCVWSAYLLCIACSFLCVGYGLWNWNRGDAPVEPSDIAWADHETQAGKDE